MKARDSQPPFGVTNRTKNSSEVQATLLVWHMLKQSLHKSPQKQHKQTLSSLNMCFALNRPGVKISTERDWVTVWKKWDFPFFCISRVTPPRLTFVREERVTKPWEGLRGRLWLCKLRLCFILDRCKAGSPGVVIANIRGGGWVVLF